MNVEGISAYKPLGMNLQPERAAAPTAAAAGSGVVEFSKMLLDGVLSINAAQNESNQLVSNFIAGKGPEVHNLMLNVEKANLSLELAVQIRNKIIDAYNEVMRIQM
jgi:flagellar hook-basal body complex protein FliE